MAENLWGYQEFTDYVREFDNKVDHLKEVEYLACVEHPTHTPKKYKLLIEGNPALELNHIDFDTIQELLEKERTESIKDVTHFAFELKINIGEVMAECLEKEEDWSYLKEDDDD